MSKLQNKNFFVYDTSYLLQDHLAIEKHGNDYNILPYPVIQEMGNFKKGDDDINEEARQFQRWLDEEIFPNITLKDNWSTLKKGLHGRIMIATFDFNSNPPVEIDQCLNDDLILWSAIQIKRRHTDARVTLLTYDINLRIKAKTWGIYTANGGTDHDISMKQMLSMKENFPVKNISLTAVQEINEKGFLSVSHVTPKKEPHPNTFYILRHGDTSWCTVYNTREKKFQLLKDQKVQGVNARNLSQKYALHVLMDPDIKLVAIHGGSGTGKTLIALASALAQRREYEQIFLARPIIPLNNKDIGFLPGDIKSKLNPYMEPLWDNFKLIKSQFSQQSSEYKQMEQLLEKEKLVIQPLAYIRGRSILNSFLIIDEAQNLTPLETKAIITRAGENTKIVFTGDVNQIDTPYLGLESNGLSYVTRKMGGKSPLCSVVTLEQGERSELANLANQLL